MNKFLGNKKLLEKRKIGFIACDISVTNGTTALIAKTTLGWAEKISSEADAVMVSGFHSTLEKVCSNICSKVSAALSSCSPVACTAGFRKCIKWQWMRTGCS